MGRLGRLAPMVAAVAVAGACGGSSPQPPNAQARAVVERFYADIANGKGAQACALLTPVAQEEIVRPLRRLPKGHNLDCETLLRAFSQGETNFLKAVKVGAASVKGDRATVVVTVTDQGLGYAPLVKTPTGWQISHIITSVRKPIEG